MSRYENRMQLALGLVIGLLLIANLFTLALVALTPSARTERAPVLFAVFLVTLVVSVPSVLLLPRWLLRPFRQLVDEAERAQGSSSQTPGRTRDETEFVLETFQGVVAQLRAQQTELERLGEEATRRAASAEQFSHRVVASLPSGLLAFDSTGRVTVINDPARALLACEEGAPTGEHFERLLESSPELRGLVSKCLESGRTFKREEVESRVKGERLRRLGVTVAPVAARAGRGADGVLCMLTDLTEVAELRETVARKRNLESLGEMSAGLAHEFKNALATLHGYAQLLQNPVLDERARLTATGELLQEVRGLSEMVTSFLNFARPRPLDFSVVSLDEILSQCSTELRPFYDENRIVLDIVGSFPEVRADERMLRQAILNLLRNAAEAVMEGANERRVVVSGGGERGEAEHDVWAKIEIADSGLGIADSDLRSIFIPFFTTKAKGHGVGLALAHRVVADHGGTLSASNAEEGGAVFTIRLPISAQI